MIRPSTRLPSFSHLNRAVPGQGHEGDAVHVILGQRPNKFKKNSVGPRARGGPRQSVKNYVVLVTTPNRRVSERLSKGLVEKKLAACVNRIPHLGSRYWWKGKVETAREELLIIKTHSGRLMAMMRWVKANHPYTVCEILALPVATGNSSYLRWIRQSLA
jgi:periplasmic divalent cation tolerance protein